MRRKTLLWILLSATLVVLMGAGSVFAAGFALYEGSARGLVLGAGLTATADDPSAVFYNPAGITQLKGMQTMVGATLINPRLDVVTGSTLTSMDDNWFFPPHAYFTQQINNRFSWGMGLFSRFGLGTEFSNTWPGRYSSTKATIQSLELNPNIAFRVADGFSVAAGVSAMWFDANLQRMLNTGALG
ncbi:MAG TPA: outer membrane protein transport protein, partial [Syntrophales bacterium]|nr:outer membrane protein transport protein [Syntrophales bacterium]